MAETLLKIENLTKEYEGQKILDGINLEVKQGDVLVVVGPSGCGKSTLLRCINALEPIQGGTIKLQGMDIRKGSKNITTLRQKIGMVFQSYELFPHLTVLDNITLAPVKVQKRDKAEAQKEASSKTKLAEEKLASVGTLEQENSRLKTALETANREVSRLKKEKMVLHDKAGELAGKRNDLEAYLGGLAKKLFVMLEGNYSGPTDLQLPNLRRATDLSLNCVYRILPELRRGDQSSGAKLGPC